MLFENDNVYCIHGSIFSIMKYLLKLGYSYFNFKLEKK